MEKVKVKETYNKNILYYIMSNYFAKTQGYTKTIIKNNLHKQPNINSIAWNIDYNGKKAKVDMKLKKNGKRKQLDRMSCGNVTGQICSLSAGGITSSSLWKMITQGKSWGSTLSRMKRASRSQM